MKMSSKLMLTLALVAISSCYAFPKRLATDNQQLLTQLLSSSLVPSPHSSSYSLPSSRDNFHSRQQVVNGGNEFGNDNDDDNNDDDDQNDNSSINAHLAAYPNIQQLQQLSMESSPLFSRIDDDARRLYPSSASSYPLQNGMNSNAMMRLKAGVWAALARSGEDEEVPSYSRGALRSSEILRGKRYIPGLDALLMARFFNHRNSRFVDAGKWKRQPHLGFHASRG